MHAGVEKKRFALSKGVKKARVEIHKRPTPSKSQVSKLKDTPLSFTSSAPCFQIAPLTTLAISAPKGTGCAHTAFDYSLLVLSKLRFPFSPFTFHKK